MCPWAWMRNGAWITTGPYAYDTDNRAVFLPIDPLLQIPAAARGASLARTGFPVPHQPVLEAPLRVSTADLRSI
jgi:hypothetical protein